MSLLNGEKEHIEGGQPFDLICGTITTGVVGGCAYKIFDLIQTQPPEWGVAAGSIGVIAVAFAGMTAYEFGLFNGSHENNE